MTGIEHLWGPKYRGLGGYFKKMGELAITPAHFPFLIGAACSFVLIASIPISEQDYKESKFTNRAEIMEAKKLKTGSYH